MVLGLILLIFALPVTLWAAGFRTKVNLNTPTVVAETDKPTGDWKVSGFFTAGERLIFTIKEGADWEMYADESEPEFQTNILTIPMSIIDPANGTTDFTIVFTILRSPQSLTPPLSFFGGNPTHNDGGLTMEAQYVWAANNESVFYNYVGGGTNLPGIPGIVKYSGYYTAVVNKDWGSREPPSSLKLYEQEVSTVSPYLSSVAPVGVTVMVSGIALSVWGWRQPKYRARQKSHDSR
jgi:hypothetical protein